MEGVLRKISDEPKAATITVQSLAQILDPSMTEQDLGSALAKLALHAKEGSYKTVLLPVQPGGTLSEQTSQGVVKDVLGGSVTSPAKGEVLTVGLKNASGKKNETSPARVALVNGGYNVIDAGTGSSVASSKITYSDPANKKQATEVAETLGLPSSAVVKRDAASNADVLVVLGSDYKPSGA
jgi:LytR cell envelope-related transcriptional attenuator